MKAIGVVGLDDIRQAERYRGTCDAVLFDTKSPSRGGTGEKFDWGLLESYDGAPFLLSGGIGPQDGGVVSAFRHPGLLGLDLNSCFETAPGVKNIGALRSFIEAVRPEKEVFKK